jgi:isoquinoline 1-oxidoreductase alpha subunit
MTTLNINGQTHTVDAPPDMPLLWVLRDLVGLTGTKFGCGIAQCGACTVHLDGQAVRSCVLPIAAVGRAQGHDHRSRQHHASGQTSAGGMGRARCCAVRVLSVGSGDVGGFADRLEPQPLGCRYRRCNGGQHLPLRYIQSYPCSGQARRQGGVTCREDYSMHRTTARIRRPESAHVFKAGDIGRR